MVEDLVKKWFELLQYSKDRDNFDQDVFKVKHDSLASWYKKMSVEQQGEYTHLIAGSDDVQPETGKL